MWREMPVMRSISRWVAPPLSSVQMVVCRCGFKTFNLGLPRNKGAKVTSCLSGLTAPDAMDSMRQITVARVEQFWWPPGCEPPQLSRFHSAISNDSIAGQEPLDFVQFLGVMGSPIDQGIQNGPQTFAKRG
ncbi:hypothetical protein D9M69_582760 [compost metagenome]